MFERLFFAGSGSKKLIISVDTANYNIFIAAGSPSVPTNIELIILPGVKVYSTSSSTPALILGPLPAGTLLKITNKGYIVGAGGKGGNANFI